MKHRLIYFLLFVFLVSCQSKEEKASLAKGKEVYIANCITCHQPDGMGVEAMYPSLVKPETIIWAQTERAINLIKNGSGFEAGMKPVALTDQEIMDVINFIQNSWGNEASFLTLSQIKEMKRNN